MNRLTIFLSEKTDIPAEVVTLQPKIELTGNSLLYMENHKGIKYLSKNEVVIKLSSGLFNVSGNNISIKEINKDHIYLTGTFTSFVFDKI